MNSALPTELGSLRARLKETFPTASSAVQQLRYIPTGVEGLDRLLDGGVTQGNVSAWTGRSGAGILSVLRATVHHALQHGFRVAVVDGTARFVASDWSGSPNASNLWMIRLRDTAKSFMAAEVLSRCGAFEFVVVDVGAFRAPTQVQRAHLRRAAREGASALLLTGEKVGVLGAKIVKIDSAKINLRTLERTLRISLIKGGVPRSVEVVLDVSGQFISCRMPSYSALPDRRPRAKRSSS